MISSILFDNEDELNRWLEPRTYKVISIETIKIEKECDDWSPYTQRHTYMANIIRFGMKNKVKKYRFFYHYYKQKKKMSVHFRGKCYVVDDVWCDVPCQTKWNKTQPNLVMQGWAAEVYVDTNNQAVIRDYISRY